MKTAWLAGLDPAKAEEFKTRVKSSSDVLDRLSILVQKELDSVERRGLKEDDYEKMDWTHAQAFRNGRIATLTWLNDLLTF
jgi:hypothetical protein